MGRHGLAYKGGLDKGGIANVKVKSMVTGYAEAKDAKELFEKQLKEMNILKEMPLFTAAMASFDALVIEEKSNRETDTTVEVVPCIKFVVLTGTVAAAYHEAYGS